MSYTTTMQHDKYGVLELSLHTTPLCRTNAFWTTWDRFKYYMVMIREVSFSQKYFCAHLYAAVTAHQKAVLNFRVSLYVGSTVHVWSQTQGVHCQCMQFADTGLAWDRRLYQCPTHTHIHSKRHMHLVHIGCTTANAYSSSF